MHGIDVFLLLTAFMAAIGAFALFVLSFLHSTGKSMLMVLLSLAFAALSAGALQLV